MDEKLTLLGRIYLFEMVAVTVVLLKFLHSPGQILYCSFGVQVILRAI